MAGEIGRKDLRRQVAPYLPANVLHLQLHRRTGTARHELVRGMGVPESVLRGVPGRHHKVLEETETAALPIRRTSVLSKRSQLGRGHGPRAALDRMKRIALVAEGTGAGSKRRSRKTHPPPCDRGPNLLYRCDKALIGNMCVTCGRPMLSMTKQFPDQRQVLAAHGGQTCGGAVFLAWPRPRVRADWRRVNIPGTSCPVWPG